MALQKLTGTDAFVVIDLDGASTADGVVRMAKKVLVDGARTLARSRTYAWALLGEAISGASAGINAEADGRDAALSGFVAEIAPLVESGSLSLDPAKGVTRADIADLDAVDQRNGPLHADPAGADPELADRLLATGVVAAARTAAGGLDGRTIAIEGAGDAFDAVRDAFTAVGGEVVATDAGALTADADILVCGSRAGLVDHDVATALVPRIIVPVGPVPVTARGLAVARRRDIVVLPDFLTTSGPLLASRSVDGGGDDLDTMVRERIGGITGELMDHPDGPLLAACYRAEQYLATWRDDLPFGRPLA